MEIDFGGIVNALPGLVWTTQADGRSDFVNRGWCEYTGLGLDKAVGHGWKTAIHPDDLTSFLKSWESIGQSGVAEEIDVRLRRFDGEYRWFTLRLSRLPEDTVHGQRWCWLGSNTDFGASTDGPTRRLLDMLPIQAGFLDSAGVSEWGNIQIYKDYDMTQEELAAWTQSGAIHTDDHAETYHHLTRLLTMGEPFDARLRMKYKDGGYRWMHAKCVPCRDAQGNVMRFFSCQIDVNDLKQAENLLAAEVKLLEMVVLGEPLRQVLGDLCRQVEELCIGCFCGILVVAPEGRNFELGVGPSLPVAFNDIPDGEGPCWEAVLEKSQIVTADPAGDPRWAGSAWAARARAHGLASCWSIPIMAGSGEVSGVIAIYRHEAVGPTAREQDIIDRFAKIAGIVIYRAQTDTALQMSERELRQAYAQLSEGQRLSKTGSFTADIQQDRHRWSDEFFRIFEIDTATPPRSQLVRDMVHPDDQQLFDDEIQRWGQSAGGEFNFRIVTGDGKLKHLRGITQYMEHIADRPVVLGALQDVTENKLAEEALNLARSEMAHVARVATLNTMTASIAHEVSQPLSGILTNAGTSLLMLAADPPDVAGATGTVQRTIRDANRASEVINRLRAMFSKNASTMTTLDLNDVAKEVVALSESQLRRSRVILQLDFAEDLPAVSGDRVQLQQVILNLLLNASDAMAGIEDRPRSLLVKTEPHDNDTVRLLVRDSGVGISPQAIEKLFDAFYTTKAHGMGIGLSISRSIIESHKGHLWAMANDGPGATFGFDIPCISKLWNGVADQIAARSTSAGHMQPASLPRR
jgi:PAS domain S-box-containing protein